ncbi:MAG: lipopolysaccharide biosynthesis protein RfbH [Verrucomicrobiota bacterium]
MIQPGFFYYIDWPHTDERGAFVTKSMPALAITAADDQGDVTLLKVTGSSHYTQSISIEPGDLETGELRKTSYIRTDRFITINESKLVSFGTRLNSQRLQECYKAVALKHSRLFSTLAHTSNRPGDDSMRPDVDSTPQPLNPSTSTDSKPISAPYAGRVFTEDEVVAAVSSTLDFWLTLGPEGEALERELGDFLGVRRCLLTNSGSSANLLAFSALTSHKLPAEKRIFPGDEVITCAAGFPTTVTPIIQNNAIPVFIDNLPQTGNAHTSQLETAYTPGKTKAVMMAHALGNPFNLAEVVAFCRRHDLWLIEDNCDALGCTYAMPSGLAKKLELDHLLKIAEKGKHPIIRLEKSSDGVEMLVAPTGTFGDLSTQSFYPPHHLTMGEGGSINIVKDMKLKVLVESFRDWGRDCWCPSGKDNTCNKRFGWQLGDLPAGYDHKYIYSHLGYNLKPLDPQAAIGRQQVKKLPQFIEARKRNWQLLREGLAELDSYFEFSLPTHASGWDMKKREFIWDESGCQTDCSWFGFMMLVKPEAPFSRTEFARYLDENRIGNRMLFGGNLLRQPAFVQLKKDNPEALRIVTGQDQDGTLPGADRIMYEAIFIGVYPGLSSAQVNYMIDVIRKYASSYK